MCLLVNDKKLNLIEEQNKLILHIADPCSSVGKGHRRSLKQLSLKTKAIRNQLERALKVLKRQRHREKITFKVNL